MSDTVATMASERGQEYVGRWPTLVARRYNLGCEYVADAMVRAGVVAESEVGRLQQAFRRKEAVPEVADLTADAARSVTGAVRDISHELTEYAQAHCHFCGQSLRDGRCLECGDQPG